MCNCVWFVRVRLMNVYSCVYVYFNELLASVSMRFQFSVWFTWLLSVSVVFGFGYIDNVNRHKDEC